MTTILIDDEPLALSRLKRLLAQHSDMFTILGEAQNGAEGLAMVETHRPDVIFLDIEKYVFLATTDGQKFITSYTLAGLAEKLPDTFVRISRAALVNSHRIREFQKHFDNRYVLTLNDQKQTRLTTGSTYADAVRQLLEL